MSRERSDIDRRTFVGGAASMAALAATGARAQGLPLPKAPVALNVIDVGGALALMQKAFEEYRKAKPELVSRITYVKAPAPELASQDQGPAGCRPCRYRHGADRQRRSRGRSRAESLDQAPADLQRQIPRPRGELRAGRAQPAQGAGPGLRRRHQLLSFRAADRIRARAGQGCAEDGRGAARLGQGPSEALHVCAAGQFRPGPHLHDGAALHPRRQGPDGSGQGLGQDLGVSARAQPATSSIIRPAPARP